MTAVTVQLCPVSYVELRVGATETRVSCPRCATHHAREFLRDRDETLCGCGHRLSAHGPRYDLAYACPLSTCTCNEKEKPMAETTNYDKARSAQDAMSGVMTGSAAETSLFQDAAVAALLAQVDATRAQTDAIRELTKAVTDADKSRRSTVV